MPSSTGPTLNTRHTRPNHSPNQPDLLKIGGFIFDPKNNSDAKLWLMFSASDFWVTISICDFFSWNFYNILVKTKDQV